jgi:gliding motility-associated-like protein
LVTIIAKVIMKCTAGNCFLFASSLLFILIMVTSAVHAQVFYANTALSINEITITPSGCVEKKSKFSCPEADSGIFSIALFRDTMYIEAGGKLFYTTGDQPGSCVFISDFVTVTSMVAGPDGMLYAATGNRIIYFNPHTKQQTVINDTMPFSSTGDLIFHNGKLYMAADPNLIVEVNLTNLALSKKVMELSVPFVIGLASSPGRCGNDFVYALATPNYGTTIIPIDIDNAIEFGEVCELNRSYLDATSPGFDEQPPVTIDSIIAIPVCNSSTFSSTINIAAHSPSGSVLTYELGNNYKNTTGVFADLEPGSYKLHVRSNDMCYADTSFILDKSFCHKTLIVPNAFTPNHDSRNDFLRPLGLTPAGIGIFSIYNRYGQKIFETKNFHNGWDGTFHGVEQPTGTYVWQLRYVGDNGMIVTQKGTTVLIR